MVNLTSEYDQELPKQHFHYNRLQNNIRESIPRIKITSIRKVHNKHLSLAFTVKENEMRRRNGTTVQTEEYIHATGAWKVASILKGNLDWRLVRRSKYGHGVSFSHSASYANKYCNNRNGTCRAFIFCDVLVGSRRYVNDNRDSHPPNNVDSYQSSTGYVLVKFDDFTFNPKFVVYYEDGVYDFNSTLDNAMYLRQYEFNDSSAEIHQNQQQRVLLKQILRIPLENEDFLNAIVAENNKRTQAIIQPKSNELPIQPLVMPKDAVQIEVDARRPKLRSIENHQGPELPFIENRPGILPPRANIEPIHRPTLSSIARGETGLMNASYSLSRGRLAQPTTAPNQKCKKFNLIMLFVIIIMFIGVIDYVLDAKKPRST